MIKQRSIIYSGTLAICLLLSSCYYGQDTRAVNTMLGAHIGGAVGTVIGSQSGSFAGEVFGNVLGTVAGAAIGNAAGKSAEETHEQNYGSGYSYSRTYDDDYAGTYRRPSGSRYSAANSHRPSYSSRNNMDRTEMLSNMKIKNLRFVDENRNRVINANERCTLVFDVYNGNSETVYDIVPQIYEVSGMQHISIESPAIIRELASHDKISYSIYIVTDKQLRTGTATFSIELSDDSGLSVPMREFDIKTQR